MLAIVRTRAGRSLDRAYRGSAPLLRPVSPRIEAVNRCFAGRASGGSSSGGKRGGAAASIGEEEPGRKEVDASKAEAAAEKPPSGGGGGAPADSGNSSAASSAAAAAGAKAPPPGAPALFALPLYRKPAFPGFYQIMQVSDQEVLDFLFALRKSGQGEYLGGFMTLELPSKVDGDTDTEFASTPPSTGNAPGNAGSGNGLAASQSLRRDTGRVDSAKDLVEIGTVLQVINLTQYPNISGGQIVVMPHKRVRRTRVVSAPSPTVALAAVAVEYLPEPEVPRGDENIKALHLEIIGTMKELLKTSFLYKEQFEQVIRFYDLDDPLKLADLVAGMSLAQRGELQAVLEENGIRERLKKVLMIVKKDLEFARLQSHVKSQVEEKVSKEQRRLMLKEQLRQIMKELGMEKDDKQSLIVQFREALQGKTVPEEITKVIEAELQRLGTLEPSSSEFSVCRTYLDWLTCLPWGQYTTDNKEIAKAEAILNEDHYGLEDVKERILEHMAVSFLKDTTQGKIMCLVGPPGVGKTSVGKSIARSLDRKFYRISMGGLHDVAELRGHRRTYVGAMPGKLVQCFKNTQSSNPVVLIDEIDKLGRDHRGDPSSALLEILDPEQNNTFRDHYLDVPMDLSRVLFVCTANVTDTIPAPLLDRMEVIRIAGYVFEEKVAIANQYLIPQTRESSGVGDENVELQTDALHKMISEYAREAGVRQLRKLLEKVSRKVALSMVRTPEEERTKAVIETDNLSKYIGQPVYLSDRLYPSGAPPGVVMGLAWTALGGATLFVEARGRVPLSGRIETTEDGEKKEEGRSGPSNLSGTMKVTGQLGSVMSESSAISLTYARDFIQELDKSNSFLDEAKIHLNVPEGATPKDGPSAGVTMTTALVSLAFKKPILPDVAMTGELTLTGKVLKVGGIKEKVIAAQREKIKTLILPRQNQADYAELKEYIRGGMTAHFVDHYDDVFERIFDAGDGDVPKLPGPSRGQPVVTLYTEPVEMSIEQATDTGGPADTLPTTPPAAPTTPSPSPPA